MENSSRYAAIEIFNMFKEGHRLCSPLDPMADANYELTPNSLIWDWRDAGDLLQWEELSIYLNKRFRINVSKSEWEKCFEPDGVRTIMDVCRMIAAEASKVTYPMQKPLRQECLTASVFLGFKRNLSKKGVNVLDLRPSSMIESYLVNHFDPMMEEILLRGANVLDDLKYSTTQIRKLNPNWFEKLFWQWERVKRIDTGAVKTFRDLIADVCEVGKARELVVG